MTKSSDSQVISNAKQSILTKMAGKQTNKASKKANTTIAKQPKDDVTHSRTEHVVDNEHHNEIPEKKSMMTL